MVQAWRGKVRDGDGYIICSPEYNHGYPAVLKNALDYTYYSWSRKAVAFVSWGGAGGARGVEQLRAVAVELDMVPIRHAVHIPNPWFIKDVSEIDTEPNSEPPRACSTISRGGRRPSRLLEASAFSFPQTPTSPPSPARG